MQSVFSVATRRRDASTGVTCWWPRWCAKDVLDETAAPVLPVQIGNVVRKSCERMSARRNVTGYPRDKMTNLRPAPDLSENIVKGFDKFGAEPTAPSLVPTPPPLQVRLKPRVPTGTPVSSPVQTIQDSRADIRPRFAG